jgi:hypothetical protein
MSDKSFVALITPIKAEFPPLGTWGGAGEPFPTPPIVIVPPQEPGGPPIFIWGGGNEPFPTPPIVIIPPDKPEEPPLVIWGGAPIPLPEHPIAPGGKPPTIWPSPGQPAHPIVIPPPPEEFPKPPAEVVKPPPEEGGWGYAEPPGVWFFVPGTGTGISGPKGRR